MRLKVNDLIGTAEAARIIGCTRGRVNQLIRSGGLDAVKISPRVWLVARRSAEAYRDYNPGTGRPRIGVA